jgi:hypothetical protein
LNPKKDQSEISDMFRQRPGQIIVAVVSLFTRGSGIAK